MQKGGPKKVAFLHASDPFALLGGFAGGKGRLSYACLAFRRRLRADLNRFDKLNFSSALIFYHSIYLFRPIPYIFAIILNINDPVF